MVDSCDRKDEEWLYLEDMPPKHGRSEGSGYGRIWVP